MEGISFMLFIKRNENMIKRLIFLLFLPLTIFSQNSAPAKTGLVSVGLTYSPAYCYRFLHANDVDDDLLKMRNQAELPEYGFSSGLNIALSFSKIFALEAGVVYSSKGEKTKNDDTYYIDPPRSISSAYFTYHYYYIDIPVKADFYLLKRRLKLYLTMGISTNILIVLKTTMHAEYPDGSKTKSSTTDREDLMGINIAGIAGAGISFDITKEIYIKAEPLFNCSIMPINRGGVHEFLYSIGLNTGIFYRF